jgi:hypothetical protein
MVKRSGPSEETRFLRGDLGVDGGEVEEKPDDAETEQESAKEQVLRGGTFLGRELLTWLLFRSEAGEPLLKFENEPVTVLFTGRLLLKGVAGEVTEVSVKGAMAPYAELVKQALQKGLLVHSARIRISQGERAFEATLDAEHFDVRSGKIPQLLAEEESERMTERLHLAEQLSTLVDALIAAFVEVRTSAAWKKRVVPELQSWLRGEAAAAGALKQAQRLSGGR